MSVKRGERMKRRDLIGLRSGRLTVIGYDEWKHGRPYLVCQCDCGKIKSVRDDGIITGNIRSCGCLQRDSLKAYFDSNKVIGSQNNESRERLYNIWYLMRYRCNNPKCRAYKNYGGRGIRVCADWDDDQNGYFSFKEWALSNGYEPTLEIDRINNDGDYTPDNCRWITAAEQNGNKRSNVMLTYHGETKTAAQWAKDLGFSYKAFMHRLYLGWSVERAIEQPFRNANTTAN